MAKRRCAPAPPPPPAPTRADAFKRQMQKTGANPASLAWGQFLAETDGEKKFEYFRRGAQFTWPEFLGDAKIAEDGVFEFKPTYNWNPCLERMLRAFTNTQYAVRTGEHIFRSIVMTGAGGFGKAQPLDALVYTPQGPKRMGDIRVCDLVCTPDGNVTCVMGVFPQGERDIYEVGFSDGTSARCCLEHLWEVRTERKRVKVVDTAYLLAHYKRRRKTVRARCPNPERYLFTVDLSKPVYFEPKEKLPMHPYLMGALLGDGAFGDANNKGGNIGFSSLDPEVVEKLRQIVGPTFTFKQCSRPQDFILTRKVPKGNAPNPFKDALRSLGLWQKNCTNKFIPKSYLYASVEDRFELLRGLLDTDGTVTNGKAIFYSVSSALANDVKFLVESLGGTCRIFEKQPTYFYKGKLLNGQVCYVCNITYHDPSQLFYLPRKKRLTGPKRHVGKSRVITRVEKVGRGPVQCIKVSHPRQLYVTNHCIPTHNTHVAGLYAVAWWMVDPANSIVTLTSTTKDMIRQRIWPVISHYWLTAQDPVSGTLWHETGALGKKVDSQLIIRAEEGDDKHSISALAVAHGETQKALHNLKGRHAPRMLLIIDEANGTPGAIFETIPNMRKNARDMTVIIIGNPASRLDPHGQALTPEDGWASITEDVEEWRTKSVPEWQLEPGIALRFDGFKSPNVKAGKTIFPHIYSIEDKLNAERTPNYVGSFSYWTQDRGLHPPEGFANTVFTEQLFLRCDAQAHFTFDGERQNCAFLDPAFGGDACMLYFGTLGDVAGKMCLQLTEHLEVPIDPNVQSHDVDYQIARRVQQECIVRGVKPFCFGLDATGIGRGVGAILAAEWSPQVQYMNWGMGATDRPSAMNDGRPARETYSNLVSELWFSVREALECGQIKGFSRECMAQFCSREFRMGAKHNAKKMQLEPKEDMKARVRYSPDIADACAGLLEVARRNGLGIINSQLEATVEREQRIAEGPVDVLGLGMEEGRGEVQPEDSGWAAIEIDFNESSDAIVMR